MFCRNWALAAAAALGLLVWELSSVHRLGRRCGQSNEDWARLGVRRTQWGGGIPKKKMAKGQGWENGKGPRERRKCKAGQLPQESRSAGASTGKFLGTRGTLDPILQYQS